MSGFSVSWVCPSFGSALLVSWIFSYHAKCLSGLQLLCTCRVFAGTYSSVYLLLAGNIYYGSKDFVAQDENLWSQETLRNKKQTAKQFSSEHKVAITQTTLDRTNLLDIDASLKLSFMGGLVSIGGSAQYLDNRVKKANSGIINSFMFFLIIAKAFLDAVASRQCSGFTIKVFYFSCCLTCLSFNQQPRESYTGDAEQVGLQRCL